MPAETSYTRTVHVQFKTDISGLTHFVEATVAEHIDLLTGDQANSVSIDSITDTSSGQTIFPSTLTIASFRTLTARARAAAENTL